MICVAVSGLKFSDAGAYATIQPFSAPNVSNVTTIEEPSGVVAVNPCTSGQGGA